MARVLAKEAKPFNIRVLSVCVGSLNTNISNSAVGSKNPLPEGYEGSAVDQLIRVILGGKFQVDGDKDKAAKAIYKVVVGEGVGAGREAETLLPLGRDVFPMVLLTRDSFNHIADVFGDVCNNISIDKKD